MPVNTQAAMCVGPAHHLGREKGTVRAKSTGNWLKAWVAVAGRNGADRGEAPVEVEGIPNFSALQAALGAREGPGHKAAHEAVFYAFDLLHP